MTKYRRPSISAALRLGAALQTPSSLTPQEFSRLQRDVTALHIQSKPFSPEISASYALKVAGENQ